jgi:asparagine synthase (glutamine-hydrolysing)
MCGIAGWYAPRAANDAAAQQAAVSAAVQALRHRGPDHQGTWAQGHVVLGHARLSILDLSPGAHQPMHSPCGHYTIVFNGEIFNYRELLPLVAGEEPLDTTSDTEVLLRLFRKLGPDCLPLLNGFFAFAIYDHRADTLFMARDRYGIKPLYYTHGPQGLRFGSEAAALLAMGHVPALDTQALHTYLRLNYLPPGVCMLQGMQQLLPGHRLRAAGTTLCTEAWYTLPAPASTPPPSYEAAQATFMQLLDEAVQRRLVADVPLGVFLSGGIDSSTIAALAARHTPHLHTFSIGFANKLYDETSYAQAVARMHGTEHTVFRLETADLYDAVFPMLDRLSEPFADASAVNFAILSQRTRQQVTVALSGDGADELLGGYSKHVGEWHSRQGGLRNALLRLGQPVLGLLPAHRHSKAGRKLYQLQKYAQGLAAPAAQRYLQWCSVVSPRAVNRLLAHPQDGSALLAPFVAHFTPQGDLNEVLRADMQLVLGGDMLVKADRMSMAHSLEVRVPFLDYTVVDYAMQLPAAYKVQGHARKRLLQDGVRSLLPQELYNRPKQGFEVPLRDWFRGPMRDYIATHLLDAERLHHQGIFRPQAVRQLWTAIDKGHSTKEEWTLWAILVFQHWYHRHFTA